MLWVGLKKREPPQSPVEKLALSAGRGLLANSVPKAPSIISSCRSKAKGRVLEMLLAWTVAFRTTMRSLLPHLASFATTFVFQSVWSSVRFDLRYIFTYRLGRILVETLKTYFCYSRCCYLLLDWIRHVSTHALF